VSNAPKTDFQDGAALNLPPEVIINNYFHETVVRKEVKPVTFPVNGKYLVRRFSRPWSLIRIGSNLKLIFFRHCDTPIKMEVTLSRGALGK